MIDTGSCGAAVVSTKGECDAAARALDLSDKTAHDYTAQWGIWRHWPPGCQLHGHILYVHHVGNSGACSSTYRCICRFAPPSPPPPPPSPPSPPAPPSTPPGYLQIDYASGYYMIDTGSCGAAVVSTNSECEAAARALDLSDRTAYALRTSYDRGYESPSDWAPGCQFKAHQLYLGHLGNSGACSSTISCICRFAPPSPPPPPRASPGHLLVGLR